MLVATGDGVDDDDDANWDQYNSLKQTRYSVARLMDGMVTHGNFSVSYQRHNLLFIGH